MGSFRPFVNCTGVISPPIFTFCPTIVVSLFSRVVILLSALLALVSAVVAVLFAVFDVEATSSILSFRLSRLTLITLFCTGLVDVSLNALSISFTPSHSLTAAKLASLILLPSV